MRIFDHLYARYVVRVLADEGCRSGGSYLKEKTADWSHFGPAGYKSKRRKYFVS